MPLPHFHFQRQLPLIEPGSPFNQALLMFVEKCCCGNESEWCCSACEIPLCDKCEKGDFKDECSLCESCKDSRDELANESYWEMANFELMRKKEKLMAERQVRMYNAQRIKSIKDLYK